jgi:hypothetical protein
MFVLVGTSIVNALRSYVERNIPWKLVASLYDLLVSPNNVLFIPLLVAFRNLLRLLVL